MNLKPFALLTLLTFSAALAADSVPTDHNSAAMTLTANGTASQNVTFSVPSATVTINTDFVRPGSSFDVSIPVENTTDRTITVTAQAPVVSGSLPADKFTITPKTDTTDVTAGGTGNLVYTFTFAPLVAGDQAISGKTVSVEFQLTGTGHYADATNTSF